MQVETDHQPLVSILLRLLNSTPSRLQRMLLRLQKYNLHVMYKRGKDLFLADFYGSTLLVVCDYYSNFIEVENVTWAITSGVAKALKAMFSRYGVPDVLVLDNGPQFSSAEFATFAGKWGFEHITSSPHYPQ